VTNASRRRGSPRAARLVADLLNPFTVFTALYALVAFAEEGTGRALLLVAVESLAAGLVALYVFVLRRRKRVGDFWISQRVQRLVPALVLLAAFGGLLLALYLLAAPPVLFRLALSMGLAAAAVAAVTLAWKASAHAAVAGHAAAAGLLALGPLLGLPFLVALPLVTWSRVASGAHTVAQVLAGAFLGAAFTVAFLP
jgi:hypothetical protein